LQDNIEFSELQLSKETADHPIAAIHSTEGAVELAPPLCNQHDLSQASKLWKEQINPVFFVTD